MFNAIPNDDGSSDPKWQELGADDQPPVFIEVIRKTDKRCKWGFRQLGPQQDGKRTWGPWRGATSCEDLVAKLREDYADDEVVQQLTPNVMYNARRRRVKPIELPEGLEIRKL
jgi:hypothetical protein